MASTLVHSIENNPPAPPEYCRPTCNKDKPCKGKVCPYKETNHKRESKNRGSSSKEMEIKHDIASERHEPRTVARSIRKNRGSSSKEMEIKHDIASERDGPRTSIQTEYPRYVKDGLINPRRSSDRKRKNVIKDGRNETGGKQNTPDMSIKENIDQNKKNPNEEVIDKYLLCGVALLVIFLAFGRFGLLLLFIFYAAFKVMQG